MLDNMRSSSASGFSLYESSFSRSLSNFRKLFQLSLNNTCVKFNGKINQQMEGLSMGQSLATILANNFENQFETQCLAKSI